MHASHNQFEAILGDGQLWKFRACQTAYMQLERITGLPLQRALQPAALIDPETGSEHYSREGLLSILFSLTSTHRAQEAIRMRLAPEERDIKEGFRGPYFSDIVPDKMLGSLWNDANIAIWNDMGLNVETADEVPDVAQEMADGPMDAEGND